MILNDNSKLNSFNSKPIVGLILMLLMTLILSGCGSEAPPPIAAVSTEVIPPTETTVVVDEATATSEPTDTPEPTPTLEPTDTPEPTPTNTLVSTVTPAVVDTPTPTATSEPLVRLADESVGSINLRTGPSTAYPIAGNLIVAETALILGQDVTKEWWQIETAEEGQVWVFKKLVIVSDELPTLPIVEVAPPPPTATVEVVESAEEAPSEEASTDAGITNCGKDFCVTFQDMVSMQENGGCIGNHSIYITVLQGPPPGQPMDGVVIGDTYNNVEVASGSNGPGRTEITLWSNSMTLTAKRHIDGTPYTSEESFNFTAHDELIPAEVLAAKGYCEGKVETCQWAQQNNQVCRGHYSWRVTFHKF